MDEKEKVKEETKGKGKEKTADDSGKRDKSELAKETDAANEAAERLEKAKEDLDIAEAKRSLGGMTEAGGKEPEKKPETDEEYAERVSRGEANPLQDDGFVSK